MKKVILSAAAVVVMAAAPGAAWGAGGRRLAVLPLMPAQGGTPGQGDGVALKVAERLAASYDVVMLDARDLARMLGERGFGARGLGSPALLASLGRQLGVDGVVAGSFAARAGAIVARPFLVSCASGRVKSGGEWTFAEDVSVPVPPFFVDPPFLEDGGWDFRDAVAEYDPCQDAAERVDELERRIVELKARYWAGQLAKGVDMEALKFNPGSTITDPALKRELYDRMRLWSQRARVPELSPVELKQFAEADEAAMRLARRCGIL